MNLNGIVTLLFIIGALWIAGALLIHKGVWSLDTWLGPVVIWVVAFLILWIGNTFAMKPITNQASGLAGQTVGLVNSAAPALKLPAQPESAVNPATGNTSFGGGQQAADNTTIAGGDPTGATTFSGADQQNPVVIVATPLTPPQVGELRWGGTLQPPYNDPTMPFQAACFANSQTLTTMLGQGYVPSGVQVQVFTASATFFQKPAKETWTIKVVLPHQQLSVISWNTDGITARAIKKAIGGDSVNGSGNWPLVKQSFDGTNFITVMPVECEYR